jgi:hypothetical protein
MNFKIVRQCFIVLVCLYLVSCGGGNNGQASGNPTPSNANPYLVKPTGPYQVGYKDYHYINTNICPDKYYTGNNQNYFSPENTDFCHEMMVRVYYPSNINLPLPYPQYYYPAVQDLEALMMEIDPNISLSEAQQLESLTSYTRPSLPLAFGRFPVILFNPGTITQSQRYENIIAQLVSNGYIVMGINTVFVSGSIQLPNNVIVPVSPIIFDEDMDANEVEPLSDLEFIYQQINNKNNIDPMFLAMDLAHIGALGHSLGGYVIVDAANKHTGWFQAISPLDEGLDFTKDGPVADSLAKFLLPVITPILYQFNAGGYVFLSGNNPWKGNYLPPLATNASYSAVITPSLTNDTYSQHANFADVSTLQYQPIINQAFTYVASQGGLAIGTGNGFDITNSVNNYLLQFFNYYLKNQGSNPFTGCSPLTNNTVLICGSSS